MSRKAMLMLTTGALVVVLLFSTAGAGAEENDSTLESLYRQMHQLRQQIVERRVELGDLTPEQGEQIREQMEQRFEEGLAEGFTCPGGGARGNRRGLGPGEGRGQGSGFYGSCFR